MHHQRFVGLIHESERIHCSITYAQQAAEFLFIICSSLTNYWSTAVEFVKDSLMNHPRFIRFVDSSPKIRWWTAKIHSSLSYDQQAAKLFFIICSSFSQHIQCLLYERQLIFIHSITIHKLNFFHQTEISNVHRFQTRNKIM